MGAKSRAIPPVGNWEAAYKPLLPLPDPENRYIVNISHLFFRVKHTALVFISPNISAVYNVFAARINNPAAEQRGMLFSHGTPRAFRPEAHTAETLCEIFWQIFQKK
jgi:hypothetical protein